MSLPETIQRVYHELAIRYERQNEPRLRDVFYLLAADVAHSAGRTEDAERLRIAMLEANPNSLVGPFPTFAAAMKSLDVQDYLADLRRQFPPEEADQRLLEVRANPLGNPTGPARTLSQKDTQEVIPPTARTINMPAPSNLPPRKKSPYETSLAAADSLPVDESPWRGRIAWVWILLLVIAGLGLGFWTFVRPFFEPA